MRSFEEALINAILEEYAEILCTPQNAGQQEIQHEDAQVENYEGRNTSYSVTEFDRISLWLDRQRKYIYLHPAPNTEQYIFFNEAGKEVCFQALIQSKYTLRE